MKSYKMMAFFIFWTLLVTTFTQERTASARWLSLQKIALPPADELITAAEYYQLCPILPMSEDVDCVSLTKLGKLQDDMLLYSKFPFLGQYELFSVSISPKEAENLIRSGVTFQAVNQLQQKITETDLQLHGLLDELFTFFGQLGIFFQNDHDKQVPFLRLWAPTARSVKLLFFSSPRSTDVFEEFNLKRTENGCWEIKGLPNWNRRYYQYEVEVYVPKTGQIELNRVTDPYSVSLSMNSLHSQIIDPQDAILKPEGWDGLIKPELDAFTDMVIYELHVRDFSINDKTVPNRYRGKFTALSFRHSDGMKHLNRLARTGLTHIHLLPVFDFASVEENEELQKTPYIPPQISPNSTLPQKNIADLATLDGYNWGYDPYHFMVPEGSYSSAPNGSYRILEFRKLVSGLNSIGLRVIMDVVFNHTHASGQDQRSVLDKIVPGYYYRLNDDGYVQHTSCCPDTASEHVMMEKLIIDSLIYWAKTFKIDGFRFDLMGHHTVDNLKNIRQQLNLLTLEKDGVDGQKIYLYGEGWRFGSLNDILPNQACHQANLRQTGIGSFNDRLRDSARGGNFDHATKSDQGFINGLYYDYNYSPDNTDTPSSLEEQKDLLLNYSDNIRLGLAGNLADYPLTIADGTIILGQDLKYRGASGAGYTDTPHENVNYISAHDNHTLWDQICAKAPFNAAVRLPATATAYEKMRMQILGLSLVLLGQGVPFIHAGSEMLRSKSGDGDSYNSGDWFNRLDFTYESNNWGSGLPLAEKNQADWSFWNPRLIDQNMTANQELIKQSIERFCEFLRIRQSSRLFRLRSKVGIVRRVKFLDSENKNVRIPTLIVQEISDDFEDKALDTEYKRIIVFFNADKNIARFFHPSFVGAELQLHPIQANSSDPYLKQAFFNAERATVEIPPRSTVVFIEPRFNLQAKN